MITIGQDDTNGSFAVSEKNSTNGWHLWNVGALRRQKSRSRVLNGKQFARVGKHATTRRGILSPVQLLLLAKIGMRGEPGTTPAQFFNWREIANALIENERHMSEKVGIFVHLRGCTEAFRIAG
jgi:hypothetical protein